MILKKTEPETKEAYKPEEEVLIPQEPKVNEVDFLQKSGDTDLTNLSENSTVIEDKAGGSLSSVSSPSVISTFSGLPSSASSSLESPETTTTLKLSSTFFSFSSFSSLTPSTLRINNPNYIQVRKILY